MGLVFKKHHKGTGQLSSDEEPSIRPALADKNFKPPIDPRAIVRLRQLRVYLAVLTLAYGVIAVAHILKTLALTTVIVKIITEPDVSMPTIMSWIGITGLAFFFLSVITGICGAYSAHQPDVIGAQLAVESGLARLVNLPWQKFTLYVSRFQAGLAMQTESVRPYFTEFIPSLVATCVLVPIVIGAIAWFDWISAGIIVALLPCIPIFMVLIGQLTREKTHDKTMYMEELATSVADAYSGIPTLQAVHRPHVADKFIRAVSQRYSSISRTISSIVFLSSAVLEFIATFSVAIVAVSIGMRLIYGHISLFSAVFVFLIIGEVYLPLRKVGSAFHASEDGITYMDAMLSIPENKNDDDPQEETHIGESSYEVCGSAGLCAGEVLARITPFTVVWEDGSVVTIDSHCVVEQGNIYVLYGDNGGGKTTLLRAFMGTLSIDAPGWQRADHMRILYLPTVAFTVVGTVRDNLLALTPTVNIKEMWQVAIALGLEESLDSLGIDNTMTELSLGQTQFVVVSRILCVAGHMVAQGHNDQKPACFIVVLLDEPLQFLDSIYARIIESACMQLAAMGVTIMIANHNREYFLAGKAVRISATRQQISHITEANVVAMLPEESSIS